MRKIPLGEKMRKENAQEDKGDSRHLQGLSVPSILAVGKGYCSVFRTILFRKLNNIDMLRQVPDLIRFLLDFLMPPMVCSVI
jgi:hypothetical protein